MPKILYFMAGSQPSNYDRQVVASLVGVQYRDVNAIKATDSAEECDGVAGVHIPDQYLSMPSANTAMTAFRNVQRSEANSFAQAVAVVAPTATAPAVTVDSAEKSEDE